MWYFKFHYANLEKHNVTPEEVYECFEDPNKLLQRAKDGAYTLIASTGENDILHIAFRNFLGKSIYVFHARSATAREIGLYRKKGH